MREIDLLLLEDVMMRRSFPTDARARMAQTIAILVVLLAISGVLVHAVIHRDAIGAGASQLQHLDAAPGSRPFAQVAP